ncbi:hypothetical protein [Coxiella-like endosymbiont]|uniref:hypothetical protein n=1 Tax=Coxiella-like endosymbiont TaxID=1592897 RepID=UPI00272C36E4|nr:hypothetical protein [Coxiella-like endosymbiont]
MVIATTAVRDEYTSCCYLDISFLSVVSLNMVNTALKITKELDLEKYIHTGIVHGMDSLYAV